MNEATDLTAVWCTVVRRISGAWAKRMQRICHDEQAESRLAGEIPCVPLTFPGADERQGLEETGVQVCVHVPRRVVCHGEMDRKTYIGR